MIDISVQNLKKSFGGTVVLDGVSFDVNEGERVALLGENGTGKSTLLKLLTHALEPDEGRVVLPAQKRVGLISQIPVYPAGWTTEDVLRSASAHLTEIAEKLAALEQEMAEDCSDALLRRYDALAAEYERLGGWSADHERERVANGLDIGSAMRKREFDKLSGGEKTRVNLARLILQDTDILLLDEPTNHLDLKSTEWLEEYIRRFRGTVLAVSHDRWFLDTVAQRCIELSGGKCSFYSGNYSFYVVEKKRRYEEMLRQYEKNQKEIAHLQQAADRIHLWAFMGADKLHKRAFSMEKRIEKLAQAPRPQTGKKLKARFAEQDFRGDEVIVAEELSMAFGERTLFSGLQLLVGPGERVALMGPNGSGKSTLVKLILGELSPAGGFVRTGPGIKIGYLPQIVRFDHPERTLYDTMLYECRCEPQQARDRLAAFKFAGEDAFKTVSALSGGELSRLRLCMLMGSGVNLLVLDEPTNHLDISSREWIEQALADYDGTLLFVSHDRWFVDAFATRVWELDGGRFSDFVGGFEEYQQYKQRRAQLEQTARRAQPKPAKTPKAPKPADNAKALAKIEKQIAKAEEAIAALDAEAEENAADYVRLMSIAESREAAEAELDALYAQWEELSDG